MSDGFKLDDIRNVVLVVLRTHRPPGTEMTYNYILRVATDTVKKLELKHINGGVPINPWFENYGAHDSLREDWKLAISDTLWDMVIEGILRPGTLPKFKDDMQAFHLTEYGKKVIDNPNSPFDPNGFFANMTREIPTLDPVIQSYLEESLETLRRNCLLSSTITLGCASEKAFLLLSDTLSDTLEAGLKTTYDKKIASDKFVKGQHVVFMKYYEQHIEKKLSMDKGNNWESEMTDAIDTMFSYYRNLRNKAGHPSGHAVSRDAAHSHLSVFPHYLKMMYELMAWLQSNKPIS